MEGLGIGVEHSPTQPHFCSVPPKKHKPWTQNWKRVLTQSCVCYVLTACCLTVAISQVLNLCEGS